MPGHPHDSIPQDIEACPAPHGFIPRALSNKRTPGLRPKLDQTSTVVSAALSAGLSGTIIEQRILYKATLHYIIGFQFLRNNTFHWHLHK